MSRVGWIFYDPVELTTEVMEINPNAGASPEYKKNILRKSTCGPGGQVVISEGNDEPMTFQISGVILTEDQYNFLKIAYDKRHTIQVTDDLGRVFQLYFAVFSPKRKLSRTHPWRHEYTAEAVILG